MCFNSQKEIIMISISASNKNYLSFRALTPVSYVVIDGQCETDSKIIDDVTKQFVKQIKEGREQDSELRRLLRKATGDSSLAQAYQSIKRIGKNIITGQDAINLEKIWAKSAALEQKKKEASALVKKLISGKAPYKLALIAEKIDIKGKIKYIVKNLYTTIY